MIKPTQLISLSYQRWEKQIHPFFLRYHLHWGQGLFSWGVKWEPHRAKEHFRRLCSKQVYRVLHKIYLHLHIIRESQKCGYLQKKIKLPQNTLSKISWSLHQPHQALRFPQPRWLIHPNINLSNKRITLLRERGSCAQCAHPALASLQKQGEKKKFC